MRFSKYVVYLRFLIIFRSGSLTGNSKYDGASVPATTKIRAIPKNELDKVPNSKDSVLGSKERPMGSNKYVLLL